MGWGLRSALSPTILENRIYGKGPRTNGQEREAYPKRQPLLLDESGGVNLHQKQRSYWCAFKIALQWLTLARILSTLAVQTKGLG